MAAYSSRITHFFNLQKNQLISTRIRAKDSTFFTISSARAVKKAQRLTRITSSLNSEAESQQPGVVVTNNKVLSNDGDFSVRTNVRDLNDDANVLPKNGVGANGGGGNGDYFGGGGGGGGGDDGDEEEDEFGPIMKYEDVIRETEARGVTLPEDMLEAAKSVGIRKLLLLRYLDLQVLLVVFVMSER